MWVGLEINGFNNMCKFKLRCVRSSSVPDSKISIGSIVYGAINRSTLMSTKFLHILFWVSKISRLRIFRIRYKLPVLSNYVQSFWWVPRQPSEHIRCTTITEKWNFAATSWFFFFIEIKTYVTGGEDTRDSTETGHVGGNWLDEPSFALPWTRDR